MKVKPHNSLIRALFRPALLMSLFLISSLIFTSCAVLAGSAGATPDTSESPEPSASDASPAVTAENILNVAGEWAEAVKNRDGKAQYALMSKTLQAKVYDEFSGLNWVTGTSSPWVESYVFEESAAGVRVTFDFATSAGSAGSFYQELTFETEDGATKIAAISDLKDVSKADDGTTAFPAFPALIKLLGMTKDELLAAVPETPTPADEGGLSFDKAGVRIWFDADSHTKVAQVLVLSDQIDLGGVKVGGDYSDFKSVFGQPVSDSNGDAHFKYGDIYLSVVRDTGTDKVISVYILAKDF